MFSRQILICQGEAPAQSLPQAAKLPVQGKVDLTKNACIFRQRRKRFLSPGQRLLKHRREAQREGTSSGAARHLPQKGGNPAGISGFASGETDFDKSKIWQNHRGRLIKCAAATIPVPCSLLPVPLTPRQTGISPSPSKFNRLFLVCRHPPCYNVQVEFGRSAATGWS